MPPFNMGMLIKYVKYVTLWELQKGSVRIRNALGASKRLWKAQKYSGSFKKALGG